MRIVAVGGLAMAGIAAACIGPSVSGAKAEYAKTLGIGQKATNLGGAVTATADNYDVFFTNPAGAANFSSVFVGVYIKTLDMRTRSAFDAISLRTG